MAPENSRHLNEEEAIAMVRSLLGGPPPDLLTGIGDDCAVLARPAADLCVTADAMIEGTHFRLDLMSHFEVGRRVMAANLSDLAAMGAAPRWGFLTLGLKPPVLENELGELMRGMIGLAREHGLCLAGGDMTKAPQLAISLTLLGEARFAPLLRRAARAGDAVCVTGTVGASGAGLAWLLAGRDPDDPRAAEAVAAYRRPQPRVRAGLALAESGLVRAMMDLSDGISPDLTRLAGASGLGAVVQQERLPVSAATRALAAELALDPVDLALNGGEDFELMFTCPPENLPILCEILARKQNGGLTIAQVGRMVEGGGVALAGAGGVRSISGGGFQHFGE